MKSGWTLSAWFAGIVQGVVVHMRIQPLSVGSLGRPNAFATLPLSANGNPTSIARSVRSMYSTSASASAEPQSKHQFTGFRPR